MSAIGYLYFVSSTKISKCKTYFNVFTSGTLSEVRAITNYLSSVCDKFSDADALFRAAMKFRLQYCGRYQPSRNF